MSSNILGEIISTLEELKRMHQLCFELLEQLNVACGWLLNNHINLPNEEKLASLLSKATALLQEINTKSLSDEFSQRKTSDDKYTVPFCTGKLGWGSHPPHFNFRLRTSLFQLKKPNLGCCERGSKIKHVFAGKNT